MTLPLMNGVVQLAMQTMAELITMLLEAITAPLGVAQGDLMGAATAQPSHLLGVADTTPLLETCHALVLLPRGSGWVRVHVLGGSQVEDVHTIARVNASVKIRAFYKVG